MTLTTTLGTRRGRTAVAVAALAVLALAGCAGTDGPADASSSSPSSAGTSSSSTPGATTDEITVTDMLGREVTVPRPVERVLALHPIPTSLLTRLAPETLVSVDMVFQKGYLDTDGPQYQTPDRVAELQTLPVTGVYFKGLNTEQLLELKPDVVFTMTGDPQVDALQDQLGIPLVAVSKAPIASYEQTIRTIGEVVDNEDLANQMADFWRDTAAAVQEETDGVAVGDRPTVMYTGQNGNLLGTPGKDTVFGSSIDQAGGRNVGDELPDTSNEANAVTIEQVAQWDPDVIIATTQAVKDQIMSLPEWSTLSAVRDDKVVVPPAYAGLDGVQALLGMVWTQGVVLHGDDEAAQSHLADVMRDFYQLFYGRDITDDEIAQVAQ